MTIEIDSAKLSPGFKNPVLDSQSVFRAVLNAVSFPGRIHTLQPAPEPPAPLYPATVAFCLALADINTPVWLDAPSNRKSVRDFLRFHCGCPLTEKPDDAGFAVVSDAAAAPHLAAFTLGHDMFPDRSATVVFQVRSFAAGKPVIATGPGIQDRQRLTIDGLPAWFWQDWAANHACFPLGVDLIFACGHDVIALPRSIRVEA